MRVDEVSEADILSTGLTYEEVLVVWRWLWETQQNGTPPYTIGVIDDNIEIFIRPLGWNQSFKNECGIGVYWVFDNTEYGAWVAIDVVTRTIICNPLRVDGGAPTHIPLSDVLESVEYHQRNVNPYVNPLMFSDSDLSFLTNKE